MIFVAVMSPSNANWLKNKGDLFIQVTEQPRVGSELIYSVI
jgi:hypothetical protein